jgi:hypothetical protein
MRKMHNVPSWLVSGIVIASVFAGCRSPEKSEHETHEGHGAWTGPVWGSLAVLPSGKGVFFDQDGAGQAQVVVVGGYSYSGPAGGHVQITQARLDGRSGVLSPIELPSYPIARQPVGTAPIRLSGFAPWDGNAAGGGGAFSVLLSLEYVETVGSATRTAVASAWSTFDRIVPSNRLYVTSSPADTRPGDAITAVAAGGTFSGAQGIALYDVVGDWSGTATVIRVCAGPGDSVTPSSATVVGGTASPDNSGAEPHSWTGTDLQGTYDGSDHYTILVKASYGGGVSSQWSGTFTNIQAQQGTIIPLD